MVLKKNYIQRLCSKLPSLGINISKALRNHRAILFIFSLALILRLIILILSIEQIGVVKIHECSPDSIMYMNMARDVLNGTDQYEKGFFTFGPGYAYYLALNLIVFGKSLLGIILFNVLLSSLSVVLIYRLAELLFKSKTTGLIAAFIVAISPTSIMLSIPILSDTVYLFLSLWGLILFVRGLQSGRWKFYITAGIIFGVSALMRSIGQFWPLAAAIIAILYNILADKSRRTKFKSLIAKALTTALIAYALVSVWVVRNYVVHDIPTLAFTSSGGAANVASFTLERLENRKQAEIVGDWIKSYKKEHGLTEFTQEDYFRMNLEKARQTFKRYPYEMIKTYFDLVWTNLTAIDYMHRLILQQSNPTTIRWEHRINDNNLQYAVFIFSLIGLVVLAATRRFQPLIVLGFVFVYYALMIGFTRWQGSRLFFPAQMAWPILTGLVLFHIGGFVKPLINPCKKILSAAAEKFGKFAGALNPKNIEQSRYFFILYAGFILIGIIILFRKFIFTDWMLYGGDTMQFGGFFQSFLLNSIREYSKVPVWNPYIYCGLPFIDAISGNIFYPFSVLKFIGDPYRMLGVTFILHIYFSGIFMYVTAREFGLGKIASAVSGISYMFSAYLISWIAPGHDGKIYVTTLFPLMFYFINRGFRKNPIFNFTMLAIVIGCTILAPHPQLSYYALITAFFFVCFKFVKLFKSTGGFGQPIRPAALFMAAVIVGIGISAVQIYPATIYTTEYSPRSDSLHGIKWAGHYSLHQEELFSLVVPEFTGTTSKFDSRLVYWGRNSYKDNSEYLGIIPLILAAFAFFFSSKSGSKFWGIIVIITTIYALGNTTFLFRAYLWLMPFASMLRGPSMSMMICLFAVSLMAGMFTDDLATGSGLFPPRKQRLIKNSMIIILVALAALGILYILAGQETLRLYARIFYPDLLADNPASAQKLNKAIHYLPEIKKGFIIAFAFIGALGMVLRYSMKPGASRSLLFVIPLLIMADGIYFNDRFVNIIDQKKEFGPTSMTEYLQKNAGLDRTFGFALNERVFQLYQYGIFTPYGFHGNELKWFYNLLNREGIARAIMNPRFANLVGGKYIIYPAGGVLPPDTLGPIPFDTAGVFDTPHGRCMVFINNNAYPRTFFVSSYEVIPDIKKVRDSVLRGTDDLRQKVYLEENPPLDTLASPDNDPDPVISYYSPDSIAINVQNKQDRMLILTDNYYPDWHAFVDGAKTKIYRADGTFRAIVVPEGTREVVFHDIPANYYTGRRITFIGIFITLISLVYCLYRKRGSGMLP